LAELYDAVQISDIFAVTSRLGEDKLHLLNVVFSFFNILLASVAFTKMDLNSLATMIAPNLLITLSEDPSVIVSWLGSSGEVTKMLLKASIATCGTVFSSSLHVWSGDSCDPSKSDGNVLLSDYVWNQVLGVPDNLVQSSPKGDNVQQKAVLAFGKLLNPDSNAASSSSSSEVGGMGSSLKRGVTMSSLPVRSSSSSLEVPSTNDQLGMKSSSKAPLPPTMITPTSTSTSTSTISESQEEDPTSFRNPSSRPRSSRDSRLSPHSKSSGHIKKLSEDESSD